MSILTSDGKRKTSQLIRAATMHSNLLSFILYLASFCVFAYLINEADKTYFSDNAMSPGLANREFNSVKNTEDYLNDLESLTLNNNDIPIEYLSSKFEQFGLEFYEQNFTLNHPFNKSHYHGKNVYAIHRAARASSTEAIVISTPFRNMRYKHRTTLSSVAILLSLAEQLSKLNYWAKDLIFLIGHHELVGIQAWLNAYHGLESTPFMHYSKLSSQSGIIQAAINLEIGSLTPRSLELKLVGLNGQTPNLDLFNVAVELCQRESIPATFNGQSFFYSIDDLSNFLNLLRSTTTMMFDQASGLPNGAHGLFQKFAISSLTFETLPNRMKSNVISASNVGRTIEGVLRSLNNMQQHFHRSFYFYLLPSPRRYISIGLYMIPFALAALPLPLRALNYYFRFAESPDSDNLNIWLSYNSLFLGQLYGIVTLSIPVLFSRVDFTEFFHIRHFGNVDLMMLSLGLFFLVGLFGVTITQKRKHSFELYLQSMIVLIHLSILFSALAVLNFSFGYLLCLIYVPIVFLVQALQTYNYRFSVNLFQKLLLILIHPVCLHFLCLFFYSLFEHGNKNIDGEALQKNFQKSIVAQWKSSLHYIEDWFLYDNWTFVAICIGILPAWIQLWFNSENSIKH